MHTRPRTDVENIIGLADGFFVMLDNDYRIALIAQVLERGQKPVIVALVQPDRGLIEHIKHARQPRADLAGQPDALAFAARQRARIACQRQVVETHIVQETKSFADFLEDGARDLVFLRA